LLGERVDVGAELRADLYVENIRGGIDELLGDSTRFIGRCTEQVNTLRSIELSA